ncbi:unnamed protein product [Orchesella dallaii]|uniref:Uncharacterized protein n=1 Tax=Orchesella dallaii TaxID=48710 RepID=A0ABP1R947_9HEXA
MSSSVPRSRTDSTPKGGKFQLPAPVSGRNTGGRRGVTPRSACKVNPGNSSATLAASNRKPLTAEQKLDILNRLETGNYKKGAGIGQFYEEIRAQQQSSKPTCRQNLYSTFAMVDPIATSTKNYGDGMVGSVESLSMTSSIISSATSNTADGTSLGVASVEGREGDSYVLPEYVKAFDKFASTKECYIRSLEVLAELQVKVQFAKLIPQRKILEFFKSMDRVSKIIQKFLCRNASDNMQLFLPTPPSKGSPPSLIHCDVENHKQFIDTFYRLSEVVERLDVLIRREPKDFKLETKMDSFKEMVSNLEELIKTQEQQVIEMKDLMRKAAVLNQDSASSEIGIELLEDASP